MARGLDELVESLVGEISYFGNGCTIAELISAIKKFQVSGESEKEDVAVNYEAYESADQAATPAAITEADLNLARIAWEWLVRRGEVRVGPKGEWNHLSIDDVLALPEEVVDDQAKCENEPGIASTQPNESVSRPRRHPATRPRLFVDEETVWKTLTGHGVDYKRVPMLEWKALIGIASAKEAGIVQGDLVRLTGQDKRSVPKRTDFLAQKGYISKRTTMVRKAKTSRLWLSKFAPPLLQNTDPGSQGINMTKDALIGTLDPVPWCDKWNGDIIDYLAFGQTFMALVKAWDVIRLRDLKQKLGILERKWQMKILAKECRRFVAMGVVQYAAAVFQDNRQVFKDCIRFVRDLTDDEWRKFLATGKKSSQYSDQTRDRQPKAATIPVGKQLGQARDTVVSGSPEPDVEGAAGPTFRTSVASTAWVPEKPLSNTVYETIRLAGQRGISNPNLSAATIGFSFRRYMFTHLNSMTAPGAQPPHLREFQLVSELVRIGKTTSYMYFVKDLLKTTSTQADSVTAGLNVRNSAEEVERNQTSQDPYGFPTIHTQAFSRDSVTLSTLGSVRRKSQRSQPYETLEAEANQEPLAVAVTSLPAAEAIAPRKRGRPKKRKLGEVQELQPIDASSSTTEAPDKIGNTGERTAAPQIADADLAGASHTKEIVPGAYIGQPGSLNPNSQGKVRGRPKKSLVVIFRSTKIKDLDFTPRMAEPPLQHSSPSNSQPDQIIENIVADGSATAIQTFPEGGEARAPSTETGAEELVVVDKEPSAQCGRGRKGGGSQTGRFRCEKCGKSWKNDNGLAYHLEKSQTSCNPNYIRAPTSLGEEKPRKRRKVALTPSGPGSQDLNGTPGPGMPARPERLGESVPSSSIKKFARRQALPTIGVHSPRGMQHDAGLDDQSEELEASQLQQPNGNFPVVERTSSIPPIMPRHEKESKGGQLTRNTSPSAGVITSIAVSKHHRVDKALPSLQTDPSSTSSLEIRSGQAKPSLGYQPSTQYSAHQFVPISPKRLSTPIRSPSPTRALPSTSSAMGLASQQTKSDIRRLPTVKYSPAGKITGRAIRDETTDSHHDVNDVVPKFSMPTGTDTGRLSESALRTYQAMEIIKYLLDNNGGVFPAEKALHSAVLKAWKEGIGGSNPPTTYSCGVAVKNLMREKKIKLETYSSRNNSGVFVICQLIMKVDLDPHAPVAVAMKEKVLATLPAIYVPPGFSSSTNEPADSQQPTPSPQKKGPGRRDLKLSEDIQVLAAPFYARRGLKGVRAASSFRDEMFDDPGDGRRKRSATEEGLDNSRIKRRRSGSIVLTGPSDGLRFINSGTHPAQMPVWAHHRHRQSRISPFEEDALGRLASFGTSHKHFRWQDATTQPKAKRFRVRNPGLSSLPSDFFGLRNVESGTGKSLESADFRFLEPNTFLDEEPGEYNPGDAGLSFVEAPGDKAARNELFRLETIENPPFVDCLVLKNSGLTPDAWPYYDIGFFEDNSRSFTMHGSLSRPQIVLKQTLPQTVDDMARRTMCRFKPEEWADPCWGRFLETINGCARWEVSKTGMDRLDRGSVAPDYIFINISTAEAVSSMKAVYPQWDEDRQWTLETLPYSQLDSEGDGGQREDDKYPKADQASLHAQSQYGPLGDISSPRTKRPYTRRVNVERPEPPKKLREHTAYPKGQDDYVREKNDRQGNVDWAADDTKIAAFICVGVLLGGVSRNIDWGLMCRLFPEMKVSALRRFWRSVKKDRESFVNELTEKFQLAFVEAYEKNEVPAIDFDDVVSYDWPSLVKWTAELTIRNAVGLPATRKELETEFSLQSVATEDRDWRESYHHWQRSVFNKFQDATSEPAAVVLGQTPNTLQPTLMETAKSWIRALCCTPIDKYTALDIKNKFLGLGGRDENYINELLENAIIDLERGRIAIKNKTRALATGRPYRLNDHFLKILDRYAQEEKYRLASKFKSQLDETFRQEETVIIPYLTNDGMVMAIMNLQAYGRIKVESVGQPDIPFGFEPGNYETRKFPKSYYHWGLRISPTDNYLFNGDISVLAIAQNSAVPCECPDKRLPLWCDFFGDLNKGRWAKLLGAVLFVLATRGNMDAEAASLALQPCVETFEVKAIMNWAMEVGLVQEMAHGGGLTICEWWWLVAGQQIDNEDDEPIEEAEAV